MKNLAGEKTADLTIKEELYLAGIPMRTKKSKGEVPYTVIGKIRDWKFERAWTYWMATVEHDEDGLPLDIASEMHECKNPVRDYNLGQSIRSGGHCGCPHPKNFGANPIFDDEYEKEMDRLKLKEEERTYGNISKLANEGKFNLKRFVNCYHIDDQIGLNEFAKVLNDFYE